MTEYTNLHMIIAGEEVSGGDRRTFDVINPATGEVIGKLPLADAADLDRALESAEKGFAIWRKTPAVQRAAVLHKAAGLIEERADEFARVATLEQGKPLAESRAEALGAPGLLRFLAGECQRTYGRELVRPSGQRAVVRYEPIGPAAAFSPWNFPIFTPARKLGGALAAGCSIILKSAEETPGTTLLMMQAFKDAGLPDHVAQAVFGVPDEVSRHLLASPIIRKLSFTGSTVVGKHLARLAADNLIKPTLELGGHGPVLVFNDMDVDQVLDVVAPGKTRNAGQVCISPTRFIVEEDIYERFRTGFAERLAATTVGNGMDKGTKMGPLANARRPEAMERLIGNARAKGAALDTGGERIGNQGFFFQPTVLSQVPLDADIMNEEPFGPVALINPFSSEEAMIAEANRLPYGLAAYAWTNDAARRRRLAAELETGMLGINNHAVSTGDAPFGGVKWSGYGSEDGPEGVLAFMVPKAIHEA